MQQATNIPYVKRYHMVDDVLEVGNPITKDNPYLNDGSNRRNRKPTKERFRSNKKGISLIVHKNIIPDAEGNATIVVSKFKRVWQSIAANTVIKKITTGKIRKKTVEKEVHHKARTIGHYTLMD